MIEELPILNAREWGKLITSGLVTFPPIKTPEESQELYRRTKMLEIKRQQRLKRQRKEPGQSLDQPGSSSPGITSFGAAFEANVKKPVQL
jgi:hypothetical protein